MTGGPLATVVAKSAWTKSKSPTWPGSSLPAGFDDGGAAQIWGARHAHHVGPDSPTPLQIAPNPPNLSSSSRHPSIIPAPGPSPTSTLAPNPHLRSRSTAGDAVQLDPHRRDGDAVLLVCGRRGVVGGDLQGRERRPQVAATPAAREGGSGVAGRFGHGGPAVSSAAPGSPHPFPSSTYPDYAILPL